MKKIIKISGILFVILLCVVYFLPAMQSYSNIPSEIYIQKGSTKTIDLGLPVKADVEATNVISITGETLEDVTGMQSPLVIESVDSGDATIELSLFGVTIKSVQVSVSDEMMVIPGGQSIGVTLYTRGALVVGITGVELESGEMVNPAREAGMLPGDVIMSINGTEIEDADHLSEIVDGVEGKLDIVVDRNGRELSLEVQPVKDYSDGKMRLGIWVRDSTAGVGTLTFILPGERWFAGLGHAICDLDTGSVLTVREGEIYLSEIIQVNKGESGVPGEIKGFFSSSSGNMGIILKNTEYGIYGTLYDDIDLGVFSDPIPVANRDEVELGGASILATIDSEGVKEFDCEIIKASGQDTIGQKGLVIEITDEELLVVTGGIVQGMSGSPIIQNGKLVGAVTHVFVNNPAKGYGLYADWMLEQVQ
ncbi:MAG: SpoIVB peptidase [Eubacteriales bacterium]|nr:SpoIVB peptidase [Eubacteriales bacterium]